VATNLTVPALLVYRDRGVVSAALAQELHALNHHLALKEIANAGHSLHMDQPEESSGAILDTANTALPAPANRPPPYTPPRSHCLQSALPLRSIPSVNPGAWYHAG